VFVYHTGDEKQVVGIAEVARASGETVELKAGPRLPTPVTLADLKADAAFADSPLVKQGRLSVLPITAAQAKVIERRGGR
jgi:predicted RNA-binding protein with PUA-like domain